MKKLIRLGQCKQCGICCGDCKFLSEPQTKSDGSVVRLCTVYDQSPSSCNRENYPQHPCLGHDPKNCGFYFIDSETGKVVTKFDRKPRTWFDEEYFDYFLMGYEPIEEKC